MQVLGVTFGNWAAGIAGSKKISMICWHPTRAHVRRARRSQRSVYLAESSWRCSRTKVVSLCTGPPAAVAGLGCATCSRNANPMRASRPACVAKKRPPTATPSTVAAGGGRCPGGGAPPDGALGALGRGGPPGVALRAYSPREGRGSVLSQKERGRGSRKRPRSTRSQGLRDECE